MKIRRNHFTAAAIAILLHSAAASAQSTSAHTFRIFVRGAEAGTEEVTVFESPDGWTLRGSGRLGAPLNLATEYWEARYDPSWKPLELTINQSDNANKWSVHTTVTGSTADSEVVQNGQAARRSLEAPPGSVLLPNLIFGSYEALAARLSTTAAGARLPALIIPQNTVTITVNNVTDEKIEVPGR